MTSCVSLSRTEGAGADADATARGARAARVHAPSASVAARFSRLIRRHDLNTIFGDFAGDQLGEIKPSRSSFVKLEAKSRKKKIKDHRFTENVKEPAEPRDTRSLVLVVSPRDSLG
jgi:hypothetical protein